MASRMSCSFSRGRGVLLEAASRGSVINKQQVRWKLVKPQIVPVKLLKMSEPVSGSVDMGDMSKSRKFLWDAESLNARGFLRFQKEYQPPKDAKERVVAIAKSSIAALAKADEESIRSYKLTDPRVKFDFLSKVFKDFDHSIPNSMLYMISTIDNVTDFYCTPIKTCTPYDELVRLKSELPPNLHVQKDPVRFHPDTDTKFGGVSAYPKSSTIVTGVRSQKKYKGYEAKKSWP